MAIHPSAIIDPSANLDPSVEVGAFCVIGANVTIGAGTRLHSHVVVKGETHIGRNNVFFQFGSIGEDCQDKKYAGEHTRLIIGDNNVFREGVTIHRGTIQDDSLTQIGNGNLFMVNVHAAHDCMIGDNNIFANNVALAGHVHVGDYAIVGGNTGVHQFCHIGSHSFAAAGCLLTKDLPPYVMAGGHPMAPFNINVEGLKRRGYSSEAIMQLRRAYKILYRQGNTLAVAIEQITALDPASSELQLLTDFLKQDNRGIVR